MRRGDKKIIKVGSRQKVDGEIINRNKSETEYEKH